MLWVSKISFTFVNRKKNGALKPQNTITSNMKERIKQIMESMHMSQQVFAQFIDLSPASLSGIFNGRTRPTLNIVEAIKNKIPQINTDWLMFGTGEMYKQASDENSKQPNDDAPDQNPEPTLDFGFDAPTTPQPSVEIRQPQQPTKHIRPEQPTEPVKIVERPQRHVTEIRVYYDDLTYESFLPSKK